MIRRKRRCSLPSEDIHLLREDSIDVEECKLHPLGADYGITEEEFSRFTDGQKKSLAVILELRKKFESADIGNDGHLDLIEIKVFEKNFARLERAEELLQSAAITQPELSSASPSPSKKRSIVDEEKAKEVTGTQSRDSDEDVLSPTDAASTTGTWQTKASDILSPLESHVQSEYGDSGFPYREKCRQIVESIRGNGRITVEQTMHSAQQLFCAAKTLTRDSLPFDQMHHDFSEDIASPISPLVCDEKDTVFEDTIFESDATKAQMDEERIVSPWMSSPSPSADFGPVLDKVQTDMERMKLELGELKVAVGHCECDSHQQGDGLRAATDQLQQVTDDCGYLKQATCLMRSGIDMHDEQLKHFGERQTDLLTSITRYIDQEKDDYRNEIGDIKAKVESLRREREELVSKTVNYDTKYEPLQKQYDEIVQRFHDAHRELGAADVELETLRQENESLLEQLAAYRRSQDSQKSHGEHYRKLQRKYEDMAAENELLLSEKQTLEEQLCEEQSKSFETMQLVESMEHYIEDMEEENDEVKEEDAVEQVFDAALVFAEDVCVDKPSFGESDRTPPPAPRSTVDFFRNIGGMLVASLMKGATGDVVWAKLNDSQLHSRRAEE